MTPAAAVVLAGGQSRRMGSAKALLAWHGSTLLQRTVDVLARSVPGPVVVVRAPGQPLPELPAGVTVREDPQQGLGPVQGLAVGLRSAAEQGADRAFVCSTDLPFLHPAYVRRVLAAFDEATDVVLPVARGFRQPLAAAYRTALASAAAALVAQGRLRPAHLLDGVRTRVLDEAALLADPVLAALDPELDSVVGVNTPEELAAARARPAPQVRVLPADRLVRAAAVRDLGLPPGTPVRRDGRDLGPTTTLVPGDVVTVG